VGCFQCFFATGHVTDDPFAVQRAGIVEISQKPAPKCDIRSRRQRQMQIGGFRRGRTARIECDDFGAAFFAGRHHALVQNRVAPGHVATDLDDQIGFFQIVVTARNHIFAEGAYMSRHR